jgi:uncharacterized NAD(P)/FAD-binding protein YdhS
VLIDRYGRHGRGQAYSTEIRAHLLNAMAGQMSAFADDPDHLVRWAAGRTGEGADSGGGAVTSTAFLPREDYGQYLRDTLADAEQQALPVARLTCLRSSVRDIQRSAAGRPLRLILTTGQLEADIAVLATGNVAGRPPFETPPSDHILIDPWEPGALPSVTGGDGDTVVIVGTGLTMVDLAVAIAASKPNAKIHAVSRHGLLPRTHPDSIAARNRPLWRPVPQAGSRPCALPVSSRSTVAASWR